MASNRAIMLRGTVASHQLPDDVEGHADTRSATARAAATAGFCCSSWPHFPSGDGLNSYTGFAVWASKAVRGTKSFAESAEFSGVNGPYELEGWNLKLKLIRGDPAYPGTRGAEYPRTARLSTSDFSPQAQPCPGRGRSSCITASTTWAQSERGHPSRVMTAPAA
jgi:hypothetical protein